MKSKNKKKAKSLAKKKAGKVSGVVKAKVKIKAKPVTKVKKAKSRHDQKPRNLPKKDQAFFNDGNFSHATLGLGKVRLSAHTSGSHYYLVLNPLFKQKPVGSPVEADDADKSKAIVIEFLNMESVKRVADYLDKLQHLTVVSGDISRYS